MPSAWRKLESAVRETAVELVWAQWSGIGAVALSERQAKSIVDPEALLLFSFSLTDRERRLGRVLTAWAQRGARLLSVQRAKNLASDYPDRCQDDLERFAQTAVIDGKDGRWRTLAGKKGIGAARSKDVRAGPTFSQPPALLLRLRIGLGVGIKADVLTFLLGCGGSRATVQEIAIATGYYGRAVRRSLEEMAAARLIQAVQTTPASFRIDEESWSQLLDLQDGPPPWRSWHTEFVFLAELLEWLGASHDASAYVRSSQARDLILAHRHAFELHRVALPEPDDYPGEEYLAPFARSVEGLLDRLIAVV